VTSDSLPSEQDYQQALDDLATFADLVQALENDISELTISAETLVEIALQTEAINGD
jgi:hypothetical protein